MSRLITIWFDICLLRAGPQDLPASRTLLGLTLTGYTLVSFLLSAVDYPFATALQMTLLDLGLLAVFAVSLLYLLGKMVRFNQTFTALTGSGALLGLIAWPLILSLPEGQGQDAGPLSLLISLAWLFVFGWSLVVVAHIMRHALSVSFPLAMGVSVVYTLVAIQIIGALIPIN